MGRGHADRKQAGSASLGLNEAESYPLCPLHSPLGEAFLDFSVLAHFTVFMIMTMAPAEVNVHIRRLILTQGVMKQLWCGFYCLG